MTARRNLLGALAALALLPAVAHAKLRVAASTNDLASIAASVGGDQAEVFAIARPNADPHRVEALPSYMVKVSRAQIYLKIGLGLDQWADAIISGSRNSGVKVIDCSQGVKVLELPTGKVTAAMGDVHPNGNPHYWLDPRNGAAIAHNIAEGFAAADPANAAGYRARADQLAKDADAAWQAGQQAAAKLPSRTIFAYHRSWPYFADAFGFTVASTIEPVPGIPPTGKHLAELIQIAKAQGVKLLIEEPYFPSDAGKFLERNAGVRAVVMSPSCDAPTAGSWLQHISAVLAAMTAGGVTGGTK